MGRSPAKGIADATAAKASGSRKPTKAEISRERVIAAAAGVFSERGYSGATMRNIAEAAGLRAGSIYYHYPSKELLIEAVLDMGIHNVSTSVYNAIAAIAPGSSYADRIRAAIAAHLASILKFGAYASASRHLLAQVPLEARRKHLLRRRAYEDFWLKLLESAQAAGELRGDADLRLARNFILGGLNAALDWYRPTGKPVEELAAEFTRMIEAGLLAQPLPPSDGSGNSR